MQLKVASARLQDLEKRGGGTAEKKPNLVETCGSERENNTIVGGNRTVESEVKALRN